MPKQLFWTQKEFVQNRFSDESPRVGAPIPVHDTDHWLVDGYIHMKASDETQERNTSSKRTSFLRTHFHFLNNFIVFVSVC